MDIAWGIGFIFVAMTSFFAFSRFELRPLLLIGLVSAWGIRLATHIYLRNKKKKEDWRYNNWRKEWGKYFYLRTYLQVFLLQGFLLWVISFPIMVVSQSRVTGLTAMDFLGVVIWLVGFFFEAFGDAQLTEFLANPKNKGKIMQTGLWRYTRHPNYFGEVMQWWGVFLIALSVPYGWMTIISPLTITFLLLKVSGIPMLEKKWEKDKRFQAYKKRTSAFWPRIPKQGEKK